jgi:hypothetical protein
MSRGNAEDQSTLIAKEVIMKPALSIALVAMLALALSSVGHAETTILDPSDDMYTDPNHPGTPPTITELWVANYNGSEHYERIMIRFDLDSLPLTIDSATLHLYRFFHCPLDAYTTTRFFAIAEPWTEETWNHTQHPSHTTPAFLSYTFGPDDGWYEVDITDQVEAWVSGAVENYGLVIKADFAQKWSQFYSKEYANPSLRPYLTVEHQPAGVEIADGSARLELSVSSPFSAETAIRYAIPEGSRVAIEIYNIQGRLVACPVDGEMPAGSHMVHWDGRDQSGDLLASGVYVVRLLAGNRMEMDKAILMR